MALFQPFETENNVALPQPCQQRLSREPRPPLSPGCKGAPDFLIPTNVMAQKSKYIPWNIIPTRW